MNKQLAAQHKAWVLETVDLIRMRKARPDIERISRMLKRIYGLNFIESKESLETLVEEGKINRVHFKGNVSYRRSQAPERSPESNAHTTTNRITNAIQTITKQTGDGVTFSDLEQWMLYKNPNTRLVKQRLQTALKREVKANTITLLSDDCYVLTESLPKQEKVKEFKPIVSPKPKSVQSTPTAPAAPTIDLMDTCPVETKTNGTPKTKTPKKSDPQPEKKDENPESTKRGRPLSKRKKFKKTHGPDFEDPNNIRRLTALASREMAKAGNGELTCDQCSCTAQSNKNGQPEPLLSCKDCNTKAHPSCLEYSEKLAERALNSPWQCMECKDCCVCDGADNADLMLFCDECDKGYHMNCHLPVVTSKPKGSWVCSTCKFLSRDDAVPDIPVAIKVSSRKNSTKSDATVTTQDVPSTSPEQEESRRGSKRKNSVSTDRPPSEVKRQRSTVSCSSSYPGETFIDGTVGAPSLPTPSASPRPSDTFDYEMKMSSVSERLLFPNDGTKYEDATDWTIDDVVNFFSKNGYKDQARVFKEQEIDGRSLLLMKRNDVLTALGLRLGPALKIYQKVIRLQQHSQTATFS